MTTYGSLFSGAGGFDLGCDAAGWSCRWQCEIDDAPRSVLERAWPDVPKYRDVREIRGDEIEPVDVITYGFPCQDLSVAGKRAGLDGDRSGLFFEVIRIVREMREATGGTYPRVAIAENVVGLLSADRGAAMGRCLDELADGGAMGIEWRVLDAQDYAVPQYRRRVFLVALYDPRGVRAGTVFPESEGDQRHRAPNPARDDDLIAFYSKHGKYDRPRIGIAPPLVIGTGLGIPTAVAIVGAETPPRRLTPRESERAMGWPDDHTRYSADGTEIADSARYRMCGNGVAAPVAKYVAQCIEAILQ